MPVLHQEVDAVLLRSNRIRVRFRDPLHNLHLRYVELKAARGALVSSHLTFHDHAGFLRETFHSIENLSGDSALRQHSLNHAGPVAKNGE